MNYVNDITQQRDGKDRFFKGHPQSPMDVKTQNKFTKLAYFPANESWKFLLPLIKYDNPETIEMETSTGSTQYFKRLGYLEFEHPESNEKAKIHVYQNVDNPSHLFVPFRDKNADDGICYGAGRYLEIEEQGDKFVLDFNLAYNPFCAYSDNYTCPLPPFENWLEIPINAGEKAFPVEH